MGFSQLAKAVEYLLPTAFGKEADGTGRPCQTPSALRWPIVSLTCYSGHRNAVVLLKPGEDLAPFTDPAGWCHVPLTGQSVGILHSLGQIV